MKKIFAKVREIFKDKGNRKAAVIIAGVLVGISVLVWLSLLS